jgi:hypothetical protein
VPSCESTIDSTFSSSALALILFSNTLPGTSDLMSEDVKWWRLLDYPGCPA